ncbi:MAG: hypothetical protein R3298_07725 [Gammaproteobacteria bacterium]|nr:hypothetical protein [Gammaproteobacteria bacterium]
MPTEGPAYRVISRRSAAFVLLVLVVLGAAAVFLVNQLGEAWVASFQARLDENPELAAAWLGERLRWFFLVAPAFPSIAALLVIWQGVRTLRTGYSPPAGAWIVAGQRWHCGRAARIRGHLQWLLGTVLIAITWAGSWYAHRQVEALLGSVLER